MELVLIYLAIKYLGDFHQIYQALKDKEFVDIADLEKIKQQILNKEIQAITIIDDNYPESLKMINNPPFVIFYQGNIELLNQPALMITGEFSNDLIDNYLNEAIQETSKKYVLISSDFKPLDNLIIKSFLELKKNVIMVLASSIDHHEFKFNYSNYFNNLLILSEFPFDAKINRKRILQRNRLAIGLSEALIILSSYRKSGIMNLVTHALDQGKEVYCYPGLQTENDGNNLLIQDGAHLITSIKFIK